MLAHFFKLWQIGNMDSKKIKSIIISFFVLLMLSTNSAKAIDPPYQEDLQRLTKIMGALYFLQPLCGYKQVNWRNHVAELISLEKPTNDRKQRLSGAFNEGYQSYARLYRSCTTSAKQAMIRFLQEAEISSRYIHTQFAE